MALCLLVAVPAFAQKADGGKPAPSREPRIALVIGNSAYTTSPLRNPVNDARAIAKSLREMGFEVTLKENATQSVMRQAIRSFGDQLARGGVGLFYFAGHGMQVKGRNFLIPTNADIDAEDEVEDQAVDGNLVLAKMETARNRLNIMILDACRNNPFARKFRSAASGLAQMDAPSGTLIAFATAPGSVASDGTGSNGLYTEHLLKHLATPGLPVEQLFKRVRIDVTRDTKDKQIPWESSSLKGDFYFNDRPADTAGSAAASQAAVNQAVSAALKQADDRAAAERTASQQAMEKAIKEALERQARQFEEELKARQSAGAADNATELTFWDTIKASSNPADFRAYIEQYPHGKFLALARLRAREDQPAPKPVPVAAAAAAAANVAAPQASKAPPTLVASIAPTAVAMQGPVTPGMPQVGDTWVYQASNRWNDKKVRVTHEVAAVLSDTVLDRMTTDVNAGGNNLQDWAYSRGIYVISRGGEVGPVFSPYFGAFGSIQPDMELKNIENLGSQFCVQPECNLSGKVVKMEKITVPAGSFDAYKIELGGAVRRSGFLQYTIRIDIWYAPSAKRIVKQVRETKRGLGSRDTIDTDVLELVSYKLN
jgi:uncharacterized caspase-like protein